MCQFKPEHVELRRLDRAVYDEEWIEEFLESASICVLATSVDNVPFANTNTFVYDRSRKAIYLHTARVGTLRKNVETNPNVCVTAFEMGRLLPAEVAKELSVEFSSVVAYGTAAIVKDTAEGKKALEDLAAKYFPHLKPGKDYRALTPAEASETTVYRVDIKGWSGKKKTADEDHPGAFRYNEKAPGAVDSSDA